MTDWIEHVVRAIGVRALSPQAEPTPVILVPDDYAPPLRTMGMFAINVSAAAGFRSQVLLIAQGASRTGLAVEIPELWVGSNTVGAAIEIVRPDAGVTGYTDVPLRSTDLRAGNRRGTLRLLHKSDAAADAASSIIGDVIIVTVAENYLGPFPLNAILEQGGGPTENAIIVRTQVDNQSILVIGSYRELDLRKL